MIDRSPNRMRPAVVPSLAEVEADLEILDRLPLDTLLHLRRQVGYLGVDLEAAIWRQTVRAAGPPLQPPSTAQVVQIEEAARVLGCSKDFLYRHWKTRGLGYRDDDGKLALHQNV
jgi:hypothetical protein